MPGRAWHTAVRSVAPCRFSRAMAWQKRGLMGQVQTAQEPEKDVFHWTDFTCFAELAGVCLTCWRNSSLALSATAVRAVQHLVPNFFPLLAPSERAPAVRTDFLRQDGLLARAHGGCAPGFAAQGWRPLSCEVGPYSAGQSLPVCLGCQPSVRIGPERGLLVAKQRHLGTTQARDAGADEGNSSKAMDMVCA